MKINNKSSCSRSHLISQTSNLFSLNSSQGFPGGSAVKNLPAIQETQVWSLSQEDPLEKEMATHSSILAWEIPPTEELAGLQSMWSWLRQDVVTPSPHQFLTMQGQVNLVSTPLPSQHTCKNCPLYSYQQSPLAQVFLKFPTSRLCSYNPASLNLTYASRGS